MSASPTFAERFHAESLQVADFRHLWSANVAWNVGRWMEQIAVGWIAVELTGSPFLVALLGFYRSLPLFVLGIVGGVLGDRYDRKVVILLLQVVNLVCVSSVAALNFAGSISYIHLVFAELILGTSMALDWPSRRALTVDLVGNEYLANAVALDASGQNISRIVGPLVAGSIIAVINPGVAFALLAGLYLASAFFIMRIKPNSGVPLVVRTQSVLQSLTAGFGYVLRDEAIVGVLAVTVVMNLFLFPYLQLLPVVAVDVLGTDSFGLGVLSAADGLGSLVGTLLIGAFVGKRRNGQIFCLGSVLGSTALLAFALTRSYELAVSLMLVGGLGRAGFSALQSTIILRNATNEMRGRAMGVLTLAIGVGPFGSLEVGALAESAGPSIALAANAIVCSILVVVAAARSRGLRRT